jgi:uncharacterized membrane protein
MMFPFGSFFIDFLLPLAAIVIAIWAYRIARRGTPPAPNDERITMLEEQVRGLLHRVWTLERGPVPPAAGASAPEGLEVPAQAQGSAAAAGHPLDAGAPVLGPELLEPPAAPPWTVPAGARVAAAPATPAGPALDLEQRIGARWSTWVGIVAILFAVSFFLKWSFDSDLLSPRGRVAVGAVAGLVLLLAGLGLHRRRDVPYLSEGLAGLGLGVLYLSVWAAHIFYGVLGAGAAFGAMLAVTLLGAAVAIASSRQITAALAVLGGLLTPVLLRVERPDERNLLVYLLVLDFLVLAVARVRSWPALNRLAWAGSALLLLPVFVFQPEPVNPLTRITLLSALFLLFVAVPLLSERTEYRRIGEVDLLLVVGNAAGYFWVVYVTLNAWLPLAAGPYALALAIIYRAAAADYAARVPDDQATVALHEGIAWTFLTIAIPLALDGRWVTLAWAVQGVMLLWAAARFTAPVAAWGGLAALLFAAVRVVFFDRYWYPDVTPVWNLTYLVHLLVAVALAVGGACAGRLRSPRLGVATAMRIQAVLWTVAAIVLAALFWREPRGLWPALLLAALVLGLGALARVSLSPAFLVVTPIVAAILLARVLAIDDGLARASGAWLVSRPLLSRIAACLAVAVAGAWLTRSDASPRARVLGRLMSAAGGLALLFVLSVDWTRYQGAALSSALAAGRRQAAAEISWRTQVGLSVLWTLYAAAALAWGFLRSAPVARYGALALFGLTAVKVFVVDLSAVRTAYRILSFLLLGVVLLLVSVAYQKARGPAAASPPAPTDAIGGTGGRS